MKKLMEIEVNNNRISLHDFLMFQAQYDIKLKEKNKEIERLHSIIKEVREYIEDIRERYIDYELVIDGEHILEILDKEK